MTDDLKPLFLSVANVLSLHKKVIDRFGGDPSIRDNALLESAVMSPQSSFAGEFLYEGIQGMAGSYLYGICKNHALVDGNKRTALASSATFVLMNNHKFLTSSKKMENLTRGIAEGGVSQEETTEFLKKTVVPKLEIDKSKIMVDDTAFGKSGFVFGDKAVMPKTR
jgi:death-on-curing protein